MLCVPLTDSVPAHAPEAVHEVALVEDQLNVEVPPLATLVGLALKDTVGAADTVTVAACDAVPPLPVQAKVNLVVAVNAEVLVVPLIGSDPLQPPDAVQAVALVAVQLRAEVRPLATVLGLADSVMAGAAWVTETVADCVALPPVPVQVIPKVELAVRAPVDCEPLAALVPDQEPEAVQEVALVADQVSVELPPLATVLGLAAKVIVGAGEVTETVADCDALPPVPVQVSPNVELAVRAPVDCDPLAALVPAQAPEAVQEVALVADQVSVELAPLATVLGAALKLTVGAGAVTETVADWVALPPPVPVQVSV